VQSADKKTFENIEYARTNDLKKIFLTIFFTFKVADPETKLTLVYVLLTMQQFCAMKSSHNAQKEEDLIMSNMNGNDMSNDNEILENNGLNNP